MSIKQLSDKWIKERYPLAFEEMTQENKANHAHDMAAAQGAANGIQFIIDLLAKQSGEFGEFWICPEDFDTETGTWLGCVVRTSAPDDKLIPFNHVIDHAALLAANARITTLEAKLQEAEKVIEAAKQIQCDCSIAERDSGHLIDCWRPDFDEKIETYLQNKGG